MKIAFLILVSTSILNLSFSQKKDSIEKVRIHKLSFTSGLTFVPETNNSGSTEFIFVPNIGFDYGFEFNHYMSIGFIVDLQLAQYEVITADNFYFNRHYALALSPMFVVIPINHWGIFLGGGIEIDKTKTLPLITIGSDYEINFGSAWFGKLGLHFNYMFEYYSFGFNIVIGIDFSKIAKNKK
jgi:hypothetical protein